MRITLPTTGSRGDVQPYVALGRGLQALGHRVRLATHSDFEGLARKHGLDFFPIEGSGEALQSTPAGARMLQAGANPFRFMREFTRLRKPIVRDLMERCRQACLDADLILLSPTALLVSLSVAEKLGVPPCWTALQPTTPTRYLTNPFFPPAPGWLPGEGVYNLLTHVLTGETLWQLMRSTINQARREVLGLPPLPFLGPVAQTLGKQTRLYGFSPVVVPPPPDWGPEHHVTGFWVLDEPAYRPPAELLAFLEAGPPPVCIGFGSNHNTDPGGVTRLVLRALELAGQRGVLLTGWAGLEEVRSERVFAATSVPHEWLFPRMAAVVHHGGAGTTGAALRSGVPSLAVPFMADQPFWARRAFELGVGPRPIPRKRLTAEGLAVALRAAVGDRRLRERAAQVGAQLRAEDGVARAVEVFDREVAPAVGARPPGRRTA